MDKLITILIPLLLQVESGGDWQAIGDAGLARGGLQIHAACWQDGIEALGVNWDYKTGAHDPVKATKVCRAYLLRYGKAYTRETGKEPTLEILARKWNGGPSGHRKKATLPYWEKVKAELDDASN